MLEFFITPNAVQMGAITSELIALNRSVIPGGKNALKEIAPYICERAFELATFRTELMRDEIQWEETVDGIRVFTTPYYSYFQEYGFYHVQSGQYIPGVFFITRAIDEFVGSGSSDGTVMDKIQEKTQATAVASTGAAMAAGALTGLGGLFSMMSFGYMGLSMLMGI